MRKVFELRQKGKGDRAVQLLERMHAENPTPHAAVQLAFEYQLDERLRDAAILYAFAVGEYPQFLTRGSSWPRSTSSSQTAPPTGTQPATRSSSRTIRSITTRRRSALSSRRSGSASSTSRTTATWV